MRRKHEGATFCHWCNKQLQLKAGGGYYFTHLLTPGDALPVRLHKTKCPEQALAEGYKRLPDSAVD